MNRTLVTTMAVVAVASPVPLTSAVAATAPSNLVVNPHYDSGLIGWGRDTGTSALAVSSTAGSSGTGAAVTATGAGSIGVHQTLTQTSVAGTTYVVTASVKAGSQASTVNGGLVVRETRSNGTRLAPGVSFSIKLVSSAFTTITYRYTAQYDGSALTVAARSTGASKGEMLDVDEWDVTAG